MPDKRNFPGGLTLEQWRATPTDTRLRLVRRAQCDLLGSFRFCANKRCKRACGCISDRPMECWERVKDRRKRVIKTKLSGRITIFEWARLEQLW
ncbi:MAG: hypothetical protein WBB34_01920 [Xanthobacteraceae bacterium]